VNFLTLTVKNQLVLTTVEEKMTWISSVIPCYPIIYKSKEPERTVIFSFKTDGCIQSFLTSSLYANNFTHWNVSSMLIDSEDFIKLLIVLILKLGSR
jgi:hypothetical protein